MGVHSGLITRFILSIAMFVTVAFACAAESEKDPKVIRLLDEFTEAVTEAETEAAAIIEEAKAEKNASIIKARDEAVRDLKRLIRRNTDFAEQAGIYKEVLRLDRYDENAITFFTNIGTLEQMLADLEPLVETDLLGNVVLGDAGAGAGGSAVAVAIPAGREVEGTLHVRADDRYTLWHNGKQIGSGANWTTMFTHSLTLRKNDVLAIEATDNQEGWGACGMIAAFVAPDGTAGILPQDFLVATEVPEGWQTGRVKVDWQLPNSDGVHATMKNVSIGSVAVDAVWAPTPAKTAYFIYVVK